MPKCHGRCQQIYTENVEFNIEHRIYYLARRFYSGLDARVIYSHLIGLSAMKLDGLHHSLHLQRIMNLSLNLEVFLFVTILVYL